MLVYATILLSFLNLSSILSDMTEDVYRKSSHITNMNGAFTFKHPFINLGDADVNVTFGLLFNTSTIFPVYTLIGTVNAFSS